PAAAKRAVAAGRLPRTGPVAVAGVAGGLDPALRPGDIVVATQVHQLTRAQAPVSARAQAPVPATLECPAARLVAATLRRAGLRVWTGPVVSVDHLVTRRGERAELADAGALAVDTESAWLLQDGTDLDPVVVRVIADDSVASLWRPATVAKLQHALRVLERVGPALAAWGAARGRRQVLVAGPRSFCAGVVRAIDIVDRLLEQRGAPVYVRKQIVHNRHVVTGLRERGAVFVEELSEVPDGYPVVFSAHGVAPAVRTTAAERELAVVDATCPLVSKVHAEVRRFADAGQTVLFIGHAGHEETVGTMGERPEHTVLIEDVDAAWRVQVPDPARISYLVQTTLAADEVASIVDVLAERFPLLRGPASDDICYATTNRQQALAAVTAEAQLCLVVGSANSFNSVRLVERAARDGIPAHLIEDADDIDLGWLGGVRTVALTAGASAPQSLVDDVVGALGALGPVEVHHRDITYESVEFTLPKEIRSR
ncbi:MAG: 4-hydroxy-3-methylbut-2-enyl diphosphate reductase, partial [Microlunatus sp.]|nr:4-hydroxy-3-methylbut-2-enyl diphosphate reductase [Microlunatus sp.]